MTDPSIQLFKRKGAGGLHRVPAELLERGPLEPQRGSSCCWGRGHRAEEGARDGEARPLHRRLLEQRWEVGTGPWGAGLLLFPVWGNFEAGC